jgi:uncharacterized protein
MDVIRIIEKYYEPDSKAYHFLVSHGRMVATKALQVAGRVKALNPDMKFIEEAAMLHDIGIFMTDAPGLGCFGKHQYIEHGYLGHELLLKEGLPEHALVCERHVGTGISISDIEIRNFPLPKRDMLPVSLEEKIVCFADKFYSKSKDDFERQKSVPAIRAIIMSFGQDKLKQFDEWLLFFKEPSGAIDE